jgi:hypothetical protein
MTTIQSENCRCMNTFTKTRLNRANEIVENKMFSQPLVKNAGKPKVVREKDIFAFNETDMKPKTKPKPKPKTKNDKLLDISETIGSKKNIKLKDY